MFSCSKKQTILTCSSTEVEYCALAHTSKLLWIHSLLTELKFSLPHTPILWCDNNGAISLAKYLVFHARTKHIGIEVHFIRDKIEKEELDILYISSEDQLAEEGYWRRSL